ncbi:hypothetical protein GCM10025867_32050 [Frondihabitans sucicola]|uniref:Integral membrane bound transporter domain-containing protein n=1 Tax=Frondihabitans sucicola TaxID=1268041 RepID=A0ABN6Y1I2_9MICO|nr:DUF308 domain-containing protein [Frondihabitans sucicola]BDZ50964.1 hypothetical protein GCM10025867_32050 [Frondihabitans sucicola]
MPSSRTALPRAAAVLAWPRLLLAAKAAVAAGLAWWIAPHVPGAAADFPYYAPLGAVVSMYPTIHASVRQGLQTLLGLVLGIVLALGVVALGHPTVITVAVVIGIGVLVAGLPFLGGGRDWVPMVALFVLLIGGRDSADYSWGYLVQMLIGIGVGVVVNLVVVPPLHTTRARDRLRGLRRELSARAAELAGVFRTPWPVDDSEWERRVETLPTTLAKVRAAVELSAESRRLNPRRALGRIDVESDRGHLTVSETVAFHLREVAEVTSRLARRDSEPEERRIDARLAPPLGRLLDGVASLLAAAPSDEADAARSCRRLVDEVFREIDDTGAPARDSAAASSIALSLGRAVTAVSPDASPTTVMSSTVDVGTGASSRPCPT